MTDNKSTIPISGLIVSCALSLLVGIGGTILYYNPSVKPEAVHKVSHDDWIKLLVDNSGNVLTYSGDALFKSDIKLPAVTSFSGKSKFVTDMVDKKSQTKLGYIIDVNIAPLDASTLPGSYKKADPANPADKKVPPKTVDYDVVFYFILKDKDGFPLMKVASNAETVHSGGNNHFQLYARNYIPQAVASNTKEISARIEAVKCLTCNPAEGRQAQEKHKRHSLFNF